MTTFPELLDALYQIQGAADPNHPADSLADRMAEIRDIADRMMRQSGYTPDD